eukprot:TRINITY_DN6713_c0_g1_i8.p1 TRINITY_DN6713_c0_g1~~TRINITY_DN6713_c0_g1_i8.p1  ORF type:complete len:153 (+),score=36.99 TRINITY_DN6713_c0_g1_i8:877-1335(+)
MTFTTIPCITTNIINTKITTIINTIIAAINNKIAPIYNTKTTINTNIATTINTMIANTINTKIATTINTNIAITPVLCVDTTASQIFIRASIPQEANKSPSLLKATLVTESVCPFKTKSGSWVSIDKYHKQTVSSPEPEATCSGFAGLTETE